MWLLLQGSTHSPATPHPPSEGTNGEVFVGLICILALFGQTRWWCSQKSFSPQLLLQEWSTIPTASFAGGCFIWGQSWKQAHGNDIHKTSFKSLHGERLFLVISKHNNSSWWRRGGENVRDAASMAGPDYSQWLARRVDWQQKQHCIGCGQCLIIPHRGRRIAFVIAGFTPEGCSSIPSSWHNLAWPPSDSCRR